MLLGQGGQTAEVETRVLRDVDQSAGLTLEEIFGDRVRRVAGVIGQGVHEQVTVSMRNPSNGCSGLRLRRGVHVIQQPAAGLLSPGVGWRRGVPAVDRTPAPQQQWVKLDKQALGACFDGDQWELVGVAVRQWGKFGLGWRPKFAGESIPDERHREVTDNANPGDALPGSAVQTVTNAPG